MAWHKGSLCLPKSIGPTICMNGGEYEGKRWQRRRLTGCFIDVDCPITMVWLRGYKTFFV